MCFTAKVLLELAEDSTASQATKLFVEAGLSDHLTGSEPITMLAPVDEAFKGRCVCADFCVCLCVLKGRINSNVCVCVGARMRVCVQAQW